MAWLSCKALMMSVLEAWPPTRSRRPARASAGGPHAQRRRRGTAANARGDCGYASDVSSSGWSPWNNPSPHLSPELARQIRTHKIGVAAIAKDEAAYKSLTGCITTTSTLDSIAATSGINGTSDQTAEILQRDQCRLPTRSTGENADELMARSDMRRRRDVPNIWRMTMCLLKQLGVSERWAAHACALHRHRYVDVDAPRLIRSPIGDFRWRRTQRADVILVRHLVPRNVPDVTLAPFTIDTSGPTSRFSPNNHVKSLKSALGGLHNEE